MGPDVLNVTLEQVDDEWTPPELDRDERGRDYWCAGPTHLVTLELAVTWDDPREPVTERYQLGPFVDRGQMLDSFDPEVAQALRDVEVADDLTGFDLWRMWCTETRRTCSARVHACMSGLD